MEASTQRAPILSLENRMRVERFRQTVANHPVRFLAAYIAGVIVIAGGIYSLLEADNDWFDGMWWAIVTASTVGYGDISPAELEGRFLAGFVILSGIATTAILTGLLAGWVLSAKIEEHFGTPDLDDDFDHLIGQMQALKHRYEQDEHADDRIAEAARIAHAEWKTAPESERCGHAMRTLEQALQHDY
ncbi:MAG: potassium channel family protein [Actinomycetota bacterium]|nr:potassium channel family protein [Actinomycetota bacterium]